MENFENIAKNLKELSSDKLHYTVDNYAGNFVRESYIDLYHQIQTENNFKSEKIKRFISVYEEKNINGIIDSDFIYKKAIEQYKKIESSQTELEELEKDIIKNIRLISGLRSENVINNLKEKSEYADTRIEKMNIKANKISKINTKLQNRLSEIKNIRNDFKITLLNLYKIYNEFEENNKRKLCDAEVFCNGKNNNILSGFISDKIEKEAKWEFTKGQKFEEVIFFSDKSIAFKVNNEYKTVSPIKDNYNKIANEINECVIDYILRKKPNYIPIVKELYREDFKNISHIKTMCDTFLNNEQILKNSDFDFKKEINKILVEHKHHYKKTEKLDDLMNKIIESQKIKNYANSILSNKYKDLIDDNSISLFKELFDLKISKNILQDYIGKKLASFKSNEDLNTALSSFIDKINNFDIDAIKTKIGNSNSNVRIVLEKENKLIIEVGDYSSCKSFGSTSWCIVRDESYFQSYTKEDAKQYILFDFEKNSKDIYSMIGFTLLINGELETVHAKNDNYINNFTVDYKDLYLETLSIDKNKYKLTTELNKKIDLLNKDEVKLKNFKI